MNIHVEMVLRREPADARRRKSVRILLAKGRIFEKGDYAIVKNTSPTYMGT